jgi:hypothetical protein
MEAVRLLTCELQRLHADWPRQRPYVLGQLLNPLRSMTERGWLQALELGWLRDARYWGRYCDLVRAFQQLNPDFGPVHYGCWPASSAPGEVQQQQRAQRRELELSMGERFARMLAPAEGGEAA